MKCNHCGKEMKQVFSIRDETPGALYIVNCDAVAICAFPADLGLTKFEGCVEFGIGSGDKLEFILDDDRHNSIMSLRDQDCMERYFDKPGKQEAWLVIPKGDKYEWTDVSDDICFST